MNIYEFLYNLFTLFDTITPFWSFIFSGYGLLVIGFSIICFTLITLVLMQASKSSTGIGFIGGQRQMIFGGSGGQEIFQKTTWILISFFMVSSLYIAILKARGADVDLTSLLPARFAKFLVSDTDTPENTKE